VDRGEAQISKVLDRGYHLQAKSGSAAGRLHGDMSVSGTGIGLEEHQATRNPPSSSGSSSVGSHSLSGVSGAMTMDRIRGVSGESSVTLQSIHIQSLFGSRGSGKTLSPRGSG
jgi:hypothetical protein